MTAYPVGETWIFDIGVAEIEHHFDAPGSMRYHILSGPTKGEQARVEIDVQAVCPHVFFVSWQEHDGSTVVHLEDFDRRVFHSCLTQPGAQLRRFSGSMRPA